MCKNKTNKSRVYSVHFSEYTMFRHFPNNLSIIEKCTKYNFKPQRKNCTTIRPLLSLSRFETGKFCAFWQLPLYPDRSNQKVNFLRNRVRKQLLPTLKLFFNSRIETLLLQFAEIVEVEDLYMNQITNKLLKRFIQANTQPHFFETETLFSPISLCTVNCLQKTTSWPPIDLLPLRGTNDGVIAVSIKELLTFPQKGLSIGKPMTQWVAQGTIDEVNTKNKASSSFFIRCALTVPSYATFPFRGSGKSIVQCHCTKCPGDFKSSQPFHSIDQQSRRHYSQSEYESKPLHPQGVPTLLTESIGKNDVSIESRQNKDKKNGRAAKPITLQFLSPKTIEKWCVFRPKMLATYKNTDILHPILVFPRFSVPIKASFWVWNRKIELGTIDSAVPKALLAERIGSSNSAIREQALNGTNNKVNTTVNRKMNKWSNSSITGVECSLLSTAVKELTHGMLSPKISLTKSGRKKSSIFSKAISGLNISHNKKMNTIFIHNFFFRFYRLELKRKEIYWPIVISFLPLALQRRIVKLFLLNQNWKNIRYSQIENFLAIQKNFSSH